MRPVCYREYRAIGTKDLVSRRRHVRSHVSLGLAPYTAADNDVLR